MEGYARNILPFHLADPVRAGRLVLRPIAPADFDDVHAYMSRDDVATWLPEEAYSLELSRERHPSYCRRVRFDQDGDLILIAIEFNSRVIGDLDFTARNMADGLVEIGWRVHPDFQGRGLATDATAALLELAFTAVGARRIVATMDSRNQGSIRVCERLGMRREAHHVQDRWFKGEWADTLCYAILATEWGLPRASCDGGVSDDPNEGVR